METIILEYAHQEVHLEVHWQLQLAVEQSLYEMYEDILYWVLYLET